jgi:hypothetical protein
MLPHGVIEGIMTRDTASSRRPRPWAASASMPRLGVGADPNNSASSVRSEDLVAPDLQEVDAPYTGIGSQRNLHPERDLGVRTEDTMTITVKDLEAFADGWNRHHVDFLMTYMAEDCVFETNAGPEASGKRYVGREQVREGFAGVFRRFPDVHFSNALCRAIAACRSGSSRPRAPTARRSKSRAATSSPSRATRIAVKNSYLKNRTA